MVRIVPILLFFSLLSTAAYAQLPDPCPSNQEPPSDICSQTCIYCNFNGINSTTTGYSGQTPPGGFCGSIENEQWLGFIAGAPGATFTATPSNCTMGDGVQIALYADCNAGFIACNGGAQGNGMTPVSITAPLSPGTNYFLLVDGFGGDQCDFQITVVPPAAVQAPNVGPTGLIAGPAVVCPGATVSFTVPPVTGAGAYTWTGPPGSLINGQSPPVQIVGNSGNSVDITFGSSGGQVCVFPQNSCDDGTQRCVNVVVQPIPPTILPAVTICNEDAPYELPWGQFVGTSGTYQTTLQSYQGCDSLVRQQVIVKPPILVNLGVRTVCEGNCISVFGEDYCDGGNYSVTGESFLGCDSLVNFSLLVLNPIAEINGNSVLSCANDTVVLTSVASSGTKIWRSLPSNAVVASGNVYNATQPGTYTLTVTQAAGGVLCVRADTVTVTGNTVPPTITTTGGLLGCAAVTAQISANANDPMPTYAWSGPNGFTSNVQSPVVGTPGTYIVTVTASSNGCTNTATALVTGDTQQPIAGATGDTLSCSVLSVTLNGTSSVQNSNFNWTGPGGFNSTLQNPTVNAAGTYTLIVTSNLNGCKDTTTALVAIDNAPPGATASTGGVISCNTPIITLNGGSPASNPAFSWTGPNGFNSPQQNPQADLAGVYVLTVQGSNGCTSTATATLSGNTIPPDATAAGTTLTCGAPSLPIIGNSVTPGATYSWTGPNNFTSNLQNPTVNTIGLYTLTVTGPNACTETATAIVNGDFVAPDASATGGIITCGAANTTINGASSTPGATYSWTGPGNLMSNQQSVIVNQIGTYTLTVSAPNGCTTTATADVTPDVNVPNASANGGTLNCTITSIALDGNSATPGVNLSWTGPNGFTSIQEDPTVTVPGIYTLTVENTANGCTAQADANVNLDDAEPGAEATSDILTCTNPNLPLDGTSPSNNVSWAWTGPNSFVSAEQNPVVSEPGVYELTVTGLNGCTSTDTTTVGVDQTNPVTTLSTAILTCSVTSMPINSTVSLPVTYVWSGPNNFSSTDPNPTVSNPGMYTVEVTAANGCTDTETIDVPQDIAAPDVSTAGNTISCSNPQVPLTGNSATPGATYLWAGPNNFSSTAPNPTVDADGNYTLTVTGPNGCTSTSVANVDLDVDAPQLSGTPDNILTCALTDVNIQTTIVAPNSPVQTLLWTGPNFFTSSVEDPQVQSPGTYTLLATAANGCTSVLDVNVDQDIVAPDASTTGDTLTCTITSIVLNGASTTPGATFAWTGPNNFSSPLEDPTVTVDGQYNLVVTGPNGCTTPTTATAFLNVNPPGAQSTSSNDLNCTLLSSSLAATSAAQGATYAWSGPTGGIGTTATVTTTIPGDFTVVVTGTNGCTSTSTLTVLQDVSLPGASAAGDTIDCISGIATLTGNSPTGNVTWLWNGPNQFTSPLQNPTVTIDGTYQLTVTGQNGCTSTATAGVAQNTLSPVVQLSGADTLTCVVLSLPLTGTISTPGATGVWTDPNNAVVGPGPTITASVPGIYTYTVTALNGCISSPTLTIPQNVVNPQNVEATGGLLNCNFPTVTLAGNTSTVNVSYNWTGPGGFSSPLQNPNTSNPGLYTLEVTDNVNGCISSDTALVTQDPTVPDILVTTDILTCTLDTVVLQATSNTPSVTYLWSGPNGFNSVAEDPSVSVPGAYRVVVTALSGCTSAFAIEVLQDIVEPGVSAQGVILTCTQPTGTITSTSPTANVAYSWAGPGGFTSNLQNPQVTQTGAYTVVATAPNGCTSIATAQVDPDSSIPQISANGGTVTCTVTSVQLTATSNVQNVSWAWTGPGGFNSNLQNPIVSVPGAYNLVVTASNGCTVSTGAQVLADNQSPVVETSIPDELNCTVTAVSLNASVAAAGLYGYLWSTIDGSIISGGNTANPTVSEAAEYTVQVTNLNNGCTTTEDVEVLVDPATPSDAVLSIRDVSCFGDTDGSVVINSIVGGTPPFRYSFDNQGFTSNPLYTGLEPGVYDLQVQDANGCEYFTTVTIEEPADLLVDLGPDTVIVYGNYLSLVLDTTVVNFPDRIEVTRIVPQSLLDSLAQGSFRPLTSFRYTVTVIDSNGCEATDTRLVIVEKPRNVYIPNIFNPISTDGNNLFLIFGDDKVTNIRVFQIFDRWGAAIHEYRNFKPNDTASGWDGTVRGQTGNPGVFTYYAEIEFIDGEVILYKGDVTLIRE